MPLLSESRCRAHESGGSCLPNWTSLGPPAYSELVCLLFLNGCRASSCSKLCPSMLRLQFSYSPRGLQVGPLSKSKAGTFTSSQTGKQQPLLPKPGELSYFAVMVREKFQAIREYSDFCLCHLNGSQGKWYPATFCDNKNRILCNTSLHFKVYHPNSSEQDIQAYHRLKR